MLAKRTDAPFVPTLFNDLFRDWSTTNFSETNTTLPAVNIKETQDEFIVDVAVPGMEKKDFKIDLDNDVLTISSEKTVTNEESKENYTRKEYSYRSFKRSFTLPQGIVNRDKIEAVYKSGELKITIPKLEEAKPKPIQLIEVK
ncbi:Spore protein SP21 [Polaribacter huanghezhanensis]|jgi:HSP20 family protein|uniref:Hsp20/alpha crystallin family protein n=1 Tax=Polaribacter huanghezhanensis TaxID=1354726 RepID=UPI0026485529|nr:Hsp20/alpha crystallin family protein [Polaribacter huanghezhanensis]WKD86709.1 Spore protein SP21 [Polaribacter huanghezhanensis]